MLNIFIVAWTHAHIYIHEDVKCLDTASILLLQNIMIQTLESLEVEKFQDYEFRILIHLDKIFEQSFLT